MSEPIIASWDVSLWADCPGCKNTVNLLDYPDFWDGNQSLQIAEHDSARSRNMCVVCPECGCDFHVDTEY